MVLNTPRLILREFQPSDWQRVYAYQSQPEHARFNSWRVRSEKDVKAFVNRFVQWQREIPRLRYQMAIVLKPEGRLIGNCGIRASSQSGDTELGFELDPACWHCGYATEAARAMLEFAFIRLNLSCVRAQCVSENRASARVLMRLAMRFDRTDRNSLWMKDRWWDTDQFNITREQWIGVANQMAGSSRHS